MLKRLLTAVLVLGLILAFSSTAFTDEKNMPGDGQRKAITRTPFQATGVDVFKMPVPKIAASPWTETVCALGQVPPLRTGFDVDTTVCDVKGFTDWDLSSFYVSAPRRANHVMTQLGERFDGPGLPNTLIKVNGAIVGMTRGVESPLGVRDGKINVVARVYNDVGGLPGALLYSETFAVDTFRTPPPYAWSYLDLAFTTPVTTGSSYILTVGPDVTQPTTDTMVFVFDDAGYPDPAATGVYAGRTVLYVSGVFYKAETYYPTTTNPNYRPNVDVYSDYCQVYSSCYTASTPSNGSVGLYGVPSGAYLNRLMGFGQRFASPGPETLKTVYFTHYDYAGSYGTGAFYPLTGTNGIIVKVWNDDGTGNIDYAAGALASETVAGGIANLFPATGGIADGFNTVTVNFASPAIVFGPWHVTVEMTSPVNADGRLLFLLNDPDADPGRTGGSATFVGAVDQWKRLGQSPEWIARGWAEQAFYIDVDLCKDEFSQCNVLATYDDINTGYYGGIPGSGFSRRAFAMKIPGTGFPTRLDKFRALLGDETMWGPPGTPEDNGAPEMDLRVYAVATGGEPGAVLFSKHYTEAELTLYPGWTEVVIPGGLMVGPGDYYVGAEVSLSSTTADYIYFVADAGGHPGHNAFNGGTWQIYNSTGLWGNRLVNNADDVNGVFEVEYCSVPPSSWPCLTPNDVRTAGADFARTGHTNVALTDAYCDLSLRWKHVDPLYGNLTNWVGVSGPVVYDTIVACGFGGGYRFLNLKDGSVIGEVRGGGAPYYFPSSGINMVPVIAEVMVGPDLKPLMFAGGGASSGTRVFVAFDLSSWTGVAPNRIPTLLWSINHTTWTAMGYTPFPAGSTHIGNTDFTNPVVVNIAGTDVVIFNTNSGLIWAADAATGVKFWGISNPGQTYKSMATDGTNLYLGSGPLLPTYPVGDVSCFNVADGTLKWKLSTAPGGGLKGLGLGNTYLQEMFLNGLAVDGNDLYAVSTTPTVDTGSQASLGGVLYRINKNTGAVLGAILVKARRFDGGYNPIANVMLDAATVVLAGGSRWANQGIQLYGYNRYTLGLNWSSTEGNADDNGHYFDGLITCETGDDLGFVTNSGGYLTCFNPITGEDIFSRRFNSGAPNTNIGGALGMSAGGDLLVADRNGAIFCLSKNDNFGDPFADRPRLEILNYTPQGNTYGPLPSVWVTIPDMITNTGCAPLDVTVTFATTSNGARYGATVPVNNGTASAMSIADRLTESSSKMMAEAAPDIFNNPQVTIDQRPSVNRAALATPPFFNTASLAFTLNPAETADFVIDVHQSLVYRGENVFFAYFTTNDPDYFLDAAGDDAVEPQVRGLMVGGCLLDTTTLHFGDGGDNIQWVLNVPRWGHWGDVDDATWFMDINGDQNDFYGGFLIYGVSRERIAMNTQDWWRGNGESRAYKALQGDPNMCSQNCKPALLATQTFGLITETGASYVPLVGNLICATYLDSVQMWAPYDPELGTYGTWNWNTTWLTAGTYNNDSTMGLVTNSRNIGFVDPPAAYPYLGNVVVDFMKIFKRYADAPPVLNWRIGEFIDYDIGGDTMLHFVDLSTAQAVPSDGIRLIGAWGTIKLPYGGGCNSTVYPALRNAVSMDGNQSMNNTAVRGNAYLDSVYLIMGRAAGNWSQGNMRNAPGDQRSHNTWLQHDFPDNLDTLSFAIAHYGDPELASPRNAESMAGPLSRILNKWVGMNRGDVNNDDKVNLADIVFLADYAAYGTATAAHPGPIPFPHVGDVNIDNAVNGADVTYLVDYYFHYGPCPMSKFITY